MEYSKVVGKRCIQVITYTTKDGTQCAVVTWQPINPKTGKPWQAKRSEGYYQGECSALQALARYNNVIKRERLFQ